MSRIRVNDVVHVVFWDHCADFHDAMQFECFGRVQKITKKAYVIATWAYVNPDQRLLDPHPEANENVFCIVKRAVDSIKVLDETPIHT